MRRFKFALMTVKKFTVDATRHLIHSCTGYAILELSTHSPKGSRYEHPCQ